MGKKLSEDEIKWILSLDASGAEKEMNKLKQSSYELTDRNKQLKTILTQLEAAGKKDSEQYHQLSAEMERNRDTISKNKSEMAQLTKQMGLENLSMSQLKSHAKDLQKQLDYTSKSLHPEEWEKLNADLQKTRAQMDNLTLSGRKVSSMLSDSYKKFNVFNVIGNVAGNQAALLFDRYITKMKSFANEAVGVSAKADGIKKAFARLNEPGLLDNLRKTVHGTMTDVELMQKVNLAHTFSIPLQNLSKYLEFAHLRANQTGRDFNELADAIITGIGKQSTKKLAALGLNVTELKNNIKTNGNYILGLNETIDQQIQKAGGDYVSAADAAKKRTAELANEQVKLGDQLRPIKAQYVALTQQILVWSAKELVWASEHRKGLLIVAGALGVVTVAYGLYNAAMKIHNMYMGYHNMLVSSGNKILVIRTIYTNALSAATKLAALRTTEASIAQKAFTTTEAASSVAGTLLTSTMLLLRAAMMLLTGHIQKAKEAWIAFTAISKANPWILLATAIIAAGAALIYFSTKNKELTQAQKDAMRVSGEINKKYAEEKATVEQLSKTVHDSGLSYQERYNALTELKKIAPGYHATLTKEGKLINDNTGALKSYLRQLRAKLILEASGDQLKKLYTDQEMQQETLNRYKTMHKIRRGIENKTPSKNAAVMNSSAGAVVVGGGKDYSQSNAYQRTIDDTQKKLTQTEGSIKVFERWQENARKKLDQMAGAANEAVPTTPKDELSLFDTSPTKNKKNKKNTVDPNQIELENMQSSHEKQLNAIKKYGQDRELMEEQINISTSQSDIEYYKNRIAHLQSYLASTKDIKKRAAYNKELVEAETKQAQAETDVDKNKIALLQKYREEDLKNVEEETSSQTALNDNKLANGLITQEEHDNQLLSIESAAAECRLQVQKNYLELVNAEELKNGKLKKDTVVSANQAIIKADTDAANARMEIVKKTTAGYKESLDKLNDMGGSNSIETDYKLQKAFLNSTYNAGKDYIKSNNDNAAKTGAPLMNQTSLDAAYKNASEKLEQDHQQKILEIRQKYGIQEYQKVLKNQITEIDKYEKEGILTHQEAEAQKLAASAESYKQQAQYYGNLFSNAFQAMQQSEEDEIDAKYDAEISAAQGNSEQVEKLENEKEAKKLAVQKKYADINFAVKCSQIIADTAVSIMKAFADLGPIGGAISAAFLTVTGLMQLKSAKAERDKVKHMTVGSTSSGSSVSRVAIGRESGGSILVEREQDGKIFNAKYDPDKRGFVDKPTVIVGEGKESKEWIASNAAVTNPTVAPFLSVLDQAQQAGRIKTLDFNKVIQSKVSGRSSGGSISDNRSIPTSVPGDTSGLEKAAKQLNDTLSAGIHATVVLTELEEQQNLRNKSRNIGSK